MDKALEPTDEGRTREEEEDSLAKKQLDHLLDLKCPRRLRPDDDPSAVRPPNLLSGAEKERERQSKGHNNDEHDINLKGKKASQRMYLVVGWGERRVAKGDTGR